MHEIASYTLTDRCTDQNIKIIHTYFLGIEEPHRKIKQLNVLLGSKKSRYISGLVLGWVIGL